MTPGEGAELTGLRCIQHIGDAVGRICRQSREALLHALPQSRVLGSS